MEQWETNWKDYYATLGVRMSAETEVIRGAYNAMARKYHPDVNPSGTARMKEVNEAYEVLSDSLKKADYDAVYKARWHSRYGQGQQGRGSSTRDRQWESSDTRQEGSAGENWGQHGGSEYSRTGPSAGSGRRGTEQDEAQESECEGTGEGDGIWQSASSAWRRYRQRNAGRPVYVDHREKLLPWPSRGWQQAALLLSIPFGLMLAFLTPLIWFQVGGGILFLAGSYTCLKTRCINQMENANALARFLGTLVEMVMLLVIGVAMLTLALGLVTTGIVVLAIGLLIIRAIKR